MLETGNLMLVKEIAGHKTLAMTARCSHLAPDYRRHAMES
jgi:hypothetical protein